MNLTRLNLGCGTDLRTGYCNVDLRPDCGADLVADVTNLHMIPDGTVTEILAFDILEHFPAFRTDAVLAEWARILAPGGTLKLRLPNLVALAHALNAANHNEEDDYAVLLIRNVYGGHRWGPDGEWDCHHTGFTPRLLQRRLEGFGLRVTANDGGLNMTVTAIKD